MIEHCSYSSAVARRHPTEHRSKTEEDEEKCSFVRSSSSVGQTLMFLEEIIAEKILIPSRDEFEQRTIENFFLPNRREKDNVIDLTQQGRTWE